MTIRAFLFAALATAVTGCALVPADAQAQPGQLVSIPVRVDSVTPCFTLTDTMDCGKLVASTIDTAAHTLDIQAYNFTAQDIIQAILRAKQRGVTVRVILDKISPSQICEGADPMRNAGIPVWIDHKPKIAHNKVMVIDGKTVVTGSFNFSTNAEQANAENTNVIMSTGLAQMYETNFQNRLAASTAWDGSHAKPVKACTAAADDSGA